MLSLLDAARGYPDDCALVLGGRSRSYSEMARRVALAAQRLPELPPDATSVAFTPRLDEGSLVTLWAILERGYSAVLLHPRSPDQERAERIELAGASLVLGAEDVAELNAPTSLRQRVSSNDLEPSSGAPRADESIAAVLFSSGSTGQPKGIRLSHRAFEASASASAKNLGWYDDDRWLLCMPVAHAGGLSVLSRCMLAGRAAVVHERFEPARFLEAPRREGATIASVVPTMLRALLEEDRYGALKGYRAILVGGAPTPNDLLRESRERGLPILCTYGLTEACSQVATWAMHADGPARGPLRPLAGVEVSVMGAEGELVMPDEPGRLCIRGKATMSGYCGGTQHHPSDWLDTGDVASVDAEGGLTVLARRPDLIITGGENVYPAEVEQVIAACPGVAAAVVFGVADAQWGQVVAAAIARSGPSLRMDDVDRALRLRLASYKHPRLSCIVDELPVQSLDKPNRERLAAKLRGSLQPWPSYTAERA